MVEGESGLLSVCPPWARPRYEPSRRRLTWPNGAIATTYSADEPERLRGPQHDLAFIDEPGSWRRGIKAWDNLAFGLRLGSDPRTVVSMTPRPTTLVKRLLASPSTVKTGGSTYENRQHLSSDFIAEITARYEGTRLGRQEIYAEILEVADGCWFVGWDPQKHVSTDAEWQYGLPVRLAIDCGVSRFTGAVFYQVRELAKYKHEVTVFADYICEGSYSEANALAIQALSHTVCRGQIDLVRLDPAATARTGVGPAALGEYQRVFGSRRVEFWPQHLVIDGLDQLELLLDKCELKIHPRCTALISAFNNYARASRGGEFLSYPAVEQHPAEDLMDALRGGIRDALPFGRAPQPQFRRVHSSKVI